MGVEEYLGDIWGRARDTVSGFFDPPGMKPGDAVMAPIGRDPFSADYGKPMGSSGPSGPVGTGAARPLVDAGGGGGGGGGGYVGNQQEHGGVGQYFQQPQYGFPSDTKFDLNQHLNSSGIYPMPSYAQQFGFNQMANPNSMNELFKNYAMPQYKQGLEQAVAYRTPVDQQQLIQQGQTDRINTIMPALLQALSGISGQIGGGGAGGGGGFKTNYGAEANRTPTENFV